MNVESERRYEHGNKETDQLTQKDLYIFQFEIGCIVNVARKEVIKNGKLKPSIGEMGKDRCDYSLHCNHILKTK